MKAAPRRAAAMTKALIVLLDMRDFLLGEDVVSGILPIIFYELNWVRSI